MKQLSYKSLLKRQSLSVVGQSEMLLTSLAINVLGLSLPLALLQVYDRIIPNQSTGTVFLLASGVLVALVFEALLRYWRSVALSRVGAKFEYRVGHAAFEHFANGDLLALSRSSVGDHVDRINSVSAIRDYYSGQEKVAAFDLPFSVIYIAIIYYISGSLAIIPGAVVCVAVALYLLIGFRLRRDVRFSRKCEDDRFSFIVTVLNGLFTIKAISIEASLLQRFDEHQRNLFLANRAVDAKTSLLRDLSQSAGQIVTVLVGAAGGYSVMTGSMTVGALAASTLLAGRSVQPLQAWAGYWARSQSIATAREQVAEIFALPQEDSSRDDKAANESSPPIVSGHLTLEQVHFQFDKGGKYVLSDVNLDIKAGEMIGITGRNDSGKSVLLYIMSGLYQPTAGRVFLDSKPLQAYSKADLRATIALLPQSEVIFSGTVMDNLTLFRPHLAPRALEAARIVEIKGRIDRMPAGFDTMLGDGPQDTLPRGLAQRLALARAMVMLPKILLFDEANSAVDFFGDGVIKSVLSSLRGKCTLIAVSHRPSFLEMAHRNFFMEDGTMEEMV